MMFPAKIRVSPDFLDSWLVEETAFLESGEAEPKSDIEETVEILQRFKAQIEIRSQHENWLLCESLWSLCITQERHPKAYNRVDLWLEQFPGRKLTALERLAECAQ